MLKKEIGISVIIPVHNTKAYLEECLGSLVNQDYLSCVPSVRSGNESDSKSGKGLEIICVNDHSTDGSYELLLEWEKKQECVSVLNLEDEKGAGAARNYGLSLAKGKYVVFLDSDDFFEQSFLRKLYEQAVKVNADIVLCGARRFDDRLKEYTEGRWYLKEEFLPKKEVFSRKDMNGDLYDLSTPSPWSKMFRREFVNEHQLQFQKLNNANDVYFVYMAMALAKRITTVNEVLVNYRIFRKNSLQQNKGREPLCFLKAFRSVYDDLKKRGIFEEVERGFVDQLLSAAYYNYDSVSSMDTKWKIIKGLAGDEFLGMGVMDHEDEFYHRLFNKERIQGLFCALSEHEKQEQRQGYSFEEAIVLEASNVKAPKVSVVIPVYNMEAYVGDTIESIQSQTLTDIEIVCIDDGSTDGSLEVLKKYREKDERICICTQPNGGLSVARNTGLSLAKGKYVYFLDSDDFFKESGLEQLYSLAESKGLELVTFCGSAFYENEQLKKEYQHFQTFYERKGMYPQCCTGEELLLELKMQEEYRSNVGLLFFYVDFLKKNALTFTPFILHEDNDFTFRALLSAKRAGYLNENFYVRRVRNDSIMTKKMTFANAYGYMRSFCVMEEFLKSQELETETYEMIHLILKGVLSNARKCWRSLSEAERKRELGLIGEERLRFQLFVSDPGEVDLLNRERGKKLRGIENSRSYKLSKIIGAPMKLLRELKK